MAWFIITIFLYKYIFLVGSYFLIVKHNNKITKILIIVFLCIINSNNYKTLQMLNFIRLLRLSKM